MDLEKIKNTKILGLVGNVVVVVAMLFTWVSIKADVIDLNYKIDYISTVNGKWVLIASLVSLVIIYGGKYIPNMPKELKNIKLTFITTAIQIFMFLRTMHNATANYGGGSAVKTHFGLGFYLMIIGFIMLIAFPFIYKGEEQE